jgi:hypothetical protein
MTDTTRRTVGERVSVDDSRYRGVWIVASIGPKNTVVRPLDGGRPLRVPHYMLTDPTDPATIENFEPYLHFALGEIVRLSSPKYPGLWVVIADKGNRVNVAHLGGDDDRYLRAPKSWLTSVDPKEVLK